MTKRLSYKRFQKRRRINKQTNKQTKTRSIKMRSNNNKRVLRKKKSKRVRQSGGMRQNLTIEKDPSQKFIEYLTDSNSKLSNQEVFDLIQVIFKDEKYDSYHALNVDVKDANIIKQVFEWFRIHEMRDMPRGNLLFQGLGPFKDFFINNPQIKRIYSKYKLAQDLWRLYDLKSEQDTKLIFNKEFNTELQKVYKDLPDDNTSIYIIQQYNTSTKKLITTTILMTENELKTAKQIHGINPENMIWKLRADAYNYKFLNSDEQLRNIKIGNYSLYSVISILDMFDIENQQTAWMN